MENGGHRRTQANPDKNGPQKRMFCIIFCRFLLFFVQEGMVVWLAQAHFRLFKLIQEYTMSFQFIQTHFRFSELILANSSLFRPIQIHEGSFDLIQAYIRAVELIQDSLSPFRLILVLLSLFRLISLWLIGAYLGFFGSSFKILQVYLGNFSVVQAHFSSFEFIQAHFRSFGFLNYC